jgi:hypothetical protein
MASKTQKKQKRVKKTAAPAKKTNSKGRNGGMATFIRSMGRTMKAKEVVLAGKKKGFVIPERYVYAVRTATTRRFKKTNGSPMKLQIGSTYGEIRRFENETLENIVQRHVAEIRAFILRHLRASIP